VVVSLETAARQARRARRSLEEEVERLLVHGTLHLLGHAHQRQDDARAMRAEERRIWRSVRT
jgi:probable rRNA maturation factor